MQRYFVEEKNENKFFLSKEDSYHIRVVMRGKLGENIEVINNRKTYICKIISLDEIVSCEIIDEKKEEEEVVYVTIAQALVKEQKMDYVLQKSAELGAFEILPWKAERSVVKLNEKEEKKTERWQKIVKEAAEQSKNFFIPNVSKPIDLKELCKKDYDLKLLCTVNEKSKNLKKVLSNVKKNDKMIIVVGPEGGFTPYEEEKLIENGFIPTSLGSRVLRTETAPLFILSCIKYELME